MKAFLFMKLLYETQRPNLFVSICKGSIVSFIIVVLMVVLLTISSSTAGLGGGSMKSKPQPFLEWNCSHFLFN